MAKHMAKEKKLKGIDAKTLSSILVHHPVDHGHRPHQGHDDAPAPGDHQHGGHMLRSVRQAHHDGHDIEIITTYEIRIDGRKVNVHARVENDGSLRCHSLPYARHLSAVDLIKALIDGYPEAAEAVANPRRRRGLKLEPLPKAAALKAASSKARAPKSRKSKRGAKT